jgi:N6-adenosine-specific RNA methylase IME4
MIGKYTPRGLARYEPRGKGRRIEVPTLVDQKRYSVILADPPWHFRNYSADAPGMKHSRSRSANKHYPTATIEDICKMVPPAEDNAVLLLWACWPLMPEALRVITAWGFEYKSLAWEWVKSNPSHTGFFMGMGSWTRANSEPCLLATRGKGIKRDARDVLALIYSPVREHSRKPDEQYGKIERLFPSASYLEMFARRKRTGWDVFGNEVESDVQIGASKAA